MVLGSHFLKRWKDSIPAISSYRIVQTHHVNGVSWRIWQFTWRRELSESFFQNCSHCAAIPVRFNLSWIFAPYTATVNSAGLVQKGKDCFQPKPNHQGWRGTDREIPSNNVFKVYAQETPIRHRQPCLHQECERGEWGFQKGCIICESKTTASRG